MPPSLVHRMYIAVCQPCTTTISSVPCCICQLHLGHNIIKVRETEDEFFSSVSSALLCIYWSFWWSAGQIKRHWTVQSARYGKIIYNMWIVIILVYAVLSGSHVPIGWRQLLWWRFSFLDHLQQITNSDVLGALSYRFVKYFTFIQRWLKLFYDKKRSKKNSLAIFSEDVL